MARFHLGNGARLERINWLGDATEKGIAQSYGVMVNYLYDLDDIEQNHEAFAGNRAVVASNAVKRLQRQIDELVPVRGLIVHAPLGKRASRRHAAGVCEQELAMRR